MCEIIAAASAACQGEAMMAQANLVGLAQRLVELDREQVSIRSQMLKGSAAAPGHDRRLRRSSGAWVQQS
jgi:hypothetical protein